MSRAQTRWKTVTILSHLAMCWWISWGIDYNSSQYCEVERLNHEIMFKMRKKFKKYKKMKHQVWSEKFQKNIIRTKWKQIETEIYISMIKVNNENI